MRYLRVLETGRSVRLPRGDGMLIVVVVCPGSVEQEKDELRRELQYVREMLEASLGTGG